MWLNSYFCFHRLHDCKHKDGKENCFNEALKSVYPEGVDTEMEQDLFKNILENLSQPMISSAVILKLAAVICKQEYSVY